MDPSGDLVLRSTSSAKNEGENITLSCKARIGVYKGEPFWTKDKKTLKIDQGRMNVKKWTNQTFSQLHIQNATLEDAGLYECNAVKESGERDQKSIRLTIKSK